MACIARSHAFATSAWERLECSWGFGFTTELAAAANQGISMRSQDDHQFAIATPKTGPAGDKSIGESPRRLMRHA